MVHYDQRGVGCDSIRRMLRIRLVAFEDTGTFAGHRLLYPPSLISSSSLSPVRAVWYFQRECRGRSELHSFIVSISSAVWVIQGVWGVGLSWLRLSSFPLPGSEMKCVSDR